jgi:hypothetical protein
MDEREDEREEREQPAESGDAEEEPEADDVPPDYLDPKPLDPTGR